MSEYSIILLFFFFALIIGVAAYIGSFLVINYKPYLEKNIAYECGFDAFEDARSQFDIRFYLVGILFIIFDLEVIFLFPWVLVFDKLSYMSNFGMLIFLSVLFFGFIYEWRKEALNWVD